MTIEQTVNRAAKTQGGVIGITRRPSAYYRWCLTRSRRAEYLDATFDMAGINVHNDRGHKAARPSEVKKACKDVCNLKAAFL